MGKSVFDKYVEVGRLVVGVFGSMNRKTAVIVDIVDQNKVLIDGTAFHGARRIYPLTRLRLTNFKLTGIPRGIKSTPLRKAIEDQKLVEQWSKSSLALKLAAKSRKDKLNDFGRFQLRTNKARRNYHINHTFGKLRKEAKAAAAQ